MLPIGEQHTVQGGNENENSEQSKDLLPERIKRLEQWTTQVNTKHWQLNMLT